MMKNIKRFLHLPIKIILIITVFFSTVGCAATSSASRFNKEKKTKHEKSRVKYPHKKTVKKKSSSKSEIKVYSDPADSTDEFDETPVEEKPVDKTSIIKKAGKHEENSTDVTTRESVLLEIIKYLDTPYKYGGTSNEGLDCSAFTMSVYKNSLDLDLPRSSREQYQVGDRVSKDELKFGDLVFFNTRRRSRPGHVGIYIGENQFVHASRKLGVIVSSLDEAYYVKRYMGARRVEEIETE
jgi:cell wall-associated NlpC family hydrolase